LQNPPTIKTRLSQSNETSENVKIFPHFGENFYCLHRKYPDFFNPAGGIETGATHYFVKVLIALIGLEISVIP
jgi:hypothetical protein